MTSELTSELAVSPDPCDPADPGPFPLAWHPQQPGDRPDPARFVVPSCGGNASRTQGGLWTSPMVCDRYSAWSIRHDDTESTIHLVREGWALAWPDRARTAVVDSYDDLVALVRRYPCTEHMTMAEFVRRGMPIDPTADDLPIHDPMVGPPLDFAAMAADFDALHLTEAGRQGTWMVEPGTSLWDVETVLWLAPAWTLLHPITTVAYAPHDFLGHLLQWALSLRDQPACDTDDTDDQSTAR